MASSRDYWKKREAEALNNRIKDEKAYDAEIHKIYQNMVNAANNEINAFYSKYAKAEGISLAEAKKRIDTADIEKYSKKAKQYVENSDFSAKANEEMRLYNAMMSINRMEMLKSSIGLGMVDGFDQMDKAMKENLMNSAMKEFERQAGILGETVIAARESAQAIVDSSFHNATFSERIWMHQDLLKAKLGVLLQEGLIKGENSGKLSKELTKQFNVSESDALRLMRTELSRVYTEAQKESYIRNGYKEYEIVCEPTACDMCLDEEGKHYLVEDMLPGLNAPPFHPNCHCTTAGYESTEAYEKWLEYKDNGGYDNWNKFSNEWNETHADDKSYSDRARSIHSENDLRKVSNSSIINLENHKEITNYFYDNYGIKIIGFENKELLDVKAVLAGYDDMIRAFPEIAARITRIEYNPRLKVLGRMHRNGLSEIGPDGLKDIGTGIHEAAHALDYSRSKPGSNSYSEQIVEQAKRNLRLRKNARKTIDLLVRITGTVDDINKNPEVFAFALETAKAGPANELADEIYRLARNE